MARNFRKIKNRPRKVFIKNGMHHLIEFLSKVEERIDEADRLKENGGQSGILNDTSISIIDVWEPLKSFIYNFIFASSTPQNIIDVSVKIETSGINDEKIEIATIDTGDIKIKFNTHDLFIYYGFMQSLRRKQFTGKMMHFYFLGEERTVSTKVSLVESKSNHFKKLEPTLDGRSVSEKLFLKNAIEALKDNSQVTPAGAYELKSTHKTVYLIRVYIDQERSISDLLNFPPSLVKNNEVIKKMKSNDMLKEGFAIHHADFRVPGINCFNCDNNDDIYSLNEIIRSFVINYGISFGSYGGLTKCFTCGKVIFPKKKSHRSFCSQKCRSASHKNDFGEENFACLERQRHWFTYNLFKDSEEAKEHFENETISISAKKCQRCEKYWEFGKIPGGMCDFFNKKYKITNPKKEEWINAKKDILAQQSVDDEIAFADEVAKIMARKTNKE